MSAPKRSRTTPCLDDLEEALPRMVGLVASFKFHDVPRYLAADKVIRDRRDGRVIVYGSPRVVRMAGPLWTATLVDGTVVAQTADRATDPRRIDEIVMYDRESLNVADTPLCPPGIPPNTAPVTLVHGKPDDAYTRAERSDVFYFFRKCPPDTLDAIQDVVVEAARNTDGPLAELILDTLENLVPPPPVARKVSVEYTFIGEPA